MSTLYSSGIIKAAIKALPKVVPKAVLALALTGASSSYAASHTVEIESGDTTNPTVSTTSKYGFALNLKSSSIRSSGYVAEEFFFEGNAKAYTNTSPLEADGRWNATSADLDTYFKSRFIVRRPKNVEDFNGTVVFEWQNVTGGVGVDPGWSYAAEEYLRQGYVWVGVSAQFEDVKGLKGINVFRYYGLEHPGDAWSYDIYAQAALGVLQPAENAPKPLGELTDRVERVIAHGQSQSAARILTYYNAIAPLKNIFDGFYIHSIGFASDLSQSWAGGLFERIELPETSPTPPDVVAPFPALVRTDVNKPAMVVLSEGDLPLLGAAQSFHQQPDNENLRIWEVAGASHADLILSYGIPLCSSPAANNGGSHRFVFRAGMRALTHWLEDGTAPAIAPRLQLTSPDAVTVVVDPATGIAEGGIRLPEVAVPVATNSGLRPGSAVGYPPSDTEQSGTDFICNLFGVTDVWNNDRDRSDGAIDSDGSPYPEPSVRELYGNARNYRALYLESALDSIDQGFLLEDDLEEVMEPALDYRFPWW